MLQHSRDAGSQTATDTGGWLLEPEIGTVLIECCPCCESSWHPNRVKVCGRVVYLQDVDHLVAQMPADDVSA